MSARRRFVGAVAMFGLLLTTGCANAGSTNSSPAFLDSDLVGTWTLRYFGSGQDWLCLRGDGLFKQIYVDWSVPGYHYETAWQPWWVERLSTGIMRLRLQGARYYRNGVEAAEQEARPRELPTLLPGLPPVTEEPLPRSFVDVFADESVNAPGQLVLDVRQLPSGELALFHLLGSWDDGYNPLYLSEDVFRRIDPGKKAQVPVGCR
jgi:hypothetical protein